MKIKLCRYGNYCNKKLLLGTAVYCAIILLLFRDIIAAITGICIFLAFAPLTYPKSFIMDYEMIKYTRIHHLNNRFGRGGIIVKVKYEVSHISKIELLQNPMEKLLGLGHLRFVGYTYHEAKKHMDRIEPTVVHCLYGVVMKKHRSVIEEFIKSVNTDGEKNYSSEY